MIRQCHVDYSLDLLLRMADLYRWSWRENQILDHTVPIKVNLLFGFRVIPPPGYEYKLTYIISQKGFTFLGLWFCLFPHVIFSCPCLFMSFCQVDDLRRTVSLIWVYVTVAHFILKVGLSFCSLQFVVLINRNYT